VLAVDVFHLKTSNDSDETKPFIVVGTGTTGGEDVSCKGRVGLPSFSHDIDDDVHSKSRNSLFPFFFF
jgi:hypothetical protein